MILFFRLCIIVCKQLHYKKYIHVYTCLDCPLEVETGSTDEKNDMQEKQF